MTDQWVVPEGEQWVIYRSGKFSRLADPGPLKLRAKVDTVQQRIDTRNKPRSFQVEQIFWRNSPFSCVLNFWYRTDLRAVAGGDPQQVAALAQFSDADRYSQATNMLRDALSRRLMQSGDEPPRGRTRRPLPFPLVPGSQECQHLLAAVRSELIQPLRAIGIIVDEQRSIMVEWLDVTEELRNEISAYRAASPQTSDAQEPQEGTDSRREPAQAEPFTQGVGADEYLSAADLRVLKTVPPAA